MTRFLDESVGAKPAQNPGHLCAAVLREASAEGFVLHAADGELATNKRQKEGFVVLVKEVETSADRFTPLFRRLSSLL